MKKFFSISDSPLKRQLYGICIITILTAVFLFVFMIRSVLDPAYAATHVTLIEVDGGGRRGLFAVWLLLIFILTIFNLIIWIFGYTKKK